MITIISADINKGKTTWLFNRFKSDKKGDGFICIKTFKDSIHTGYDLIRLNGGEKVSFIRKIDFIPETWQESFRIADIFSFNEKGFKFARKIADNAILHKIEPFYIDEIGPLEIEEKGFYWLFKKLIEAELDIFVAVRNFMVKDVINKFGIEKKVKFIEITEKKV